MWVDGVVVTHIFYKMIRSLVQTQVDPFLSRIMKELIFVSWLIGCPLKLSFFPGSTLVCIMHKDTRVLVNELCKIIELVVLYRRDLHNYPQFFFQPLQLTELERLKEIKEPKSRLKRLRLNLKDEDIEVNLNRQDAWGGTRLMSVSRWR